MAGEELPIVTVVIQGIVEGLTEFIPVSSTGHLIIFGHMLEADPEVAKVFDVFIQLGAILAVLFLYLDRFKGLLDFSDDKSDDSGFKGWNGIKKLVIASIPACVAGLFLHSYIKELLFYPTPVAIALIFGGVVMIIIERLNRDVKVTSIDQVTWKAALGVGVFQCFALWPGMSRSGSTIIGGLLFGLDRKIAAEFSFILAVPIMCAAVGYDLLKNISILSADHLLPFGVGFLVSFLTAIIAVKSFIRLLGRFTLEPFGYYRIALGALVLILV